jgi:hypothetical protein
VCDHGWFNGAFENARAGKERWSSSDTREVARQSERRGCSGLRTSAAAAVGFRAKASGRRVARRAPHGRSPPQLPSGPRVRLRAAGARRAGRALEYVVQKVLTAPGWGHARRSTTMHRTCTGRCIRMGLAERGVRLHGARAPRQRRRLTVISSGS